MCGPHEGFSFHLNVRPCTPVYQGTPGSTARVHTVVTHAHTGQHAYSTAAPLQDPGFQRARRRILLRIRIRLGRVPGAFYHSSITNVALRFNAAPGIDGLRCRAVAPAARALRNSSNARGCSHQPRRAQAVHWSVSWSGQTRHPAWASIRAPRVIHAARAKLPLLPRRTRMRSQQPLWRRA